MAEQGKAEADEHPSPRVSHGTLPLSLGSQIRRSAEGVLCTVDVAACYEERWQSGIAGICVGKKKYSGAAGDKRSYELKEFVEKESQREKGKVLLIITVAFMGNICGI